MPTNERSDDFGAEQIQALEEQQEALQEAFDQGEIAEPEFTRESEKIAFQIAQINDRNREANDRQQDRSKGKSFERSRDIF